MKRPVANRYYSAYLSPSASCCLLKHLSRPTLNVVATAAFPAGDRHDRCRSPAQVLADAGFTIAGFYRGETFGNTGGIHQGETCDGVLWTYLLGDLHKAGLWKGLCFCADAYQIHGRSITADNIGSLVMVSNYEALPSTRLSELWLEQYLFFRHSWVSFPNPTPFGLLRTVLSGFGLRRSYSTLCTSPRPKSLMRRSRIWPPT